MAYDSGLCKGIHHDISPISMANFYGTAWYGTWIFGGPGIPIDKGNDLSVPGMIE